ncbi:hypothetical protein SADUNF_Sadunf08G0121000 [Salix dunnii]|uniref:Uncharacterized protein n=1 Tax=Salix dunnii TaxID=1413687 RepID=A0A835JU73_9ROSI|nr:hypothetical protein SADUNF_Sadunf08G0121000 [Salix dunnii]
MISPISWTGIVSTATIIWFYGICIGMAAQETLTLSHTHMHSWACSRTHYLFVSYIFKCSRCRILFRQPPIVLPQGHGSSDVFSLSDSIKSKWFAASARYKESLSKGTRGMKEKLLARNNSVKELSKEVHREMSAGIAGVARMIERLDLTSKHTGPSMCDSDFTRGITNFSWKGKGVEQNIIAQALTKKSEEIAHDTSLGASSRASATVPAKVEISHVQVRKPLNKKKLDVPPSHA